MRKISFFILALVVSINTWAASPDVSSVITKSITKQNDNNRNRNSSIVYGGKDISRAIVATANESTWTKGQIVMIG